MWTMFLLGKMIEEMLSVFCETFMYYIVSLYR